MTDDYPHDLDALVQAREARRIRWQSFRQPATAADDLDFIRYRLDEQIETAQHSVRQAQGHLATEQQRLTALLTRRDEHDTYEAEIAALRLSQVHARYVVRDPVVIIPREPERPALRASFPPGVVA